MTDRKSWVLPKQDRRKPVPRLIDEQLDEVLTQNEEVMRVIDPTRGQASGE